MIIYVTKPWTQLNKKWGKLVIWDPEERQERLVPWALIDGIVIFSRIQLTTDVITTCLREKIPVFFITGNWKYLGKLESLDYKNVEVLYRQIGCALDKDCSLKYARTFVYSKIYNSKVMLQRWQRLSAKNIDVQDIIDTLNNHLKQVKDPSDISFLRGVEGSASRIYYKWFGRFLKSPFLRNGRTKRPPLDPVNALLSLGYTLLAQTIYMYLQILSLEPQIGFFHQPKDLRSLLVLDVMEMFRAWMVDDLVLKVIDRWDITFDDFIIDRHSQTPVLLTEDWLRKFIQSYYQFVFKKSTYDNVFDGSKWIKLKYVEKTLEEFKKSLIDKSFVYKGFLLK